MEALSPGRLIHFEIALGRHSEGVRYPVEKGKHGRDVHRFRNLRISPTLPAQQLYVLRRGAVSRLGHFGDIFEKCPVWLV